MLEACLNMAKDQIRKDGMSCKHSRATTLISKRRGLLIASYNFNRLSWKIGRRRCSRAIWKVGLTYWSSPVKSQPEPIRVNHQQDVHNWTS